MARILLIEKDRALAGEWKLALEAAGHEVVVAKDGRSALELLDETPLDLAITEIILPHVGGIAFTGMAKLKSPYLKVIAVTGDPAALDHNVGALALAERVGADLVLEKPIPADVIVEKVTRLLAEG
jgi:DNA-binding response OmpR family regulator